MINFPPQVAQTLIRGSKCKLLFVGNFNIPYYGLPNCYNNPICDNLDVFCENFELHSLNKVKNKSGRTLDLVLSEEDATVQKDDSILQQPDGFYPPLHIQLPINFPRVLSKASNISSGKFKNFNNFNNINYIELFQTLSTQYWEKVSESNRWLDKSRKDEMTDSVLKMNYQIWHAKYVAKG